MNALGTHLLLDLRECDEELLDNINYIEEAMVGAAAEAGATDCRADLPQVRSPWGHRSCRHRRVTSVHPHLARVRIRRPGHLHVRDGIRAP